MKAISRECIDGISAQIKPQVGIVTLVVVFVDTQLVVTSTLGAHLETVLTLEQGCKGEIGQGARFFSNETSGGRITLLA